MLKGASRVQIPPSPSDGQPTRRRAGRRLERRALRRGAAPARPGRRDDDRGARARRRRVLLLRVPTDEDAAAADRGRRCREERARRRRGADGRDRRRARALVAGPGDGWARRLVARRLDRGSTRQTRAQQCAHHNLVSSRSASARSSTTSSWSRPDPCRRFRRSRVSATSTTGRIARRSGRAASRPA